MAQEWLTEWSKRKGEVLTPENYSSQQAFDEIVSGFSKDIPTVKEINPTIEEPMQLQAFLDGEDTRDFYAAHGHPHFTELEKRMQAIETGNLAHTDKFRSLSFASGRATMDAVLRAISMLNPEGKFMYGDVVYSATRGLLADQGHGRNLVGSLPGVEVDTTDVEGVHKKAREILNEGIPLLGIVTEPVANPTLKYSNVGRLGSIAYEFEVPLVVDNTFLSPYLLEPFRMGADIVIHSATKYLSGQGDFLAGLATYPEEFHPHIYGVRKNGGSLLSINDAHTLAGRIGNVGDVMRAHAENTAKLAEALEDVEGISLNYKHLEDITRHGFAGGVLSFTFEGDPKTTHDQCVRFSQYLSDNPGPRQAVSLGDPETVIIPEGGQLGTGFLEKSHLPPGFVRISPGREKDFNQVIAYVKEGINYAQKA